MRLVITAVVMAALAGCAAKDPATEKPVDMLPGLYQLTIGGGTIVELKPAFASGQACFALDNALAFPTDSVSHLIPDWDGCTTTHDDPKGNAISGLRNCPGGEGHKRKTSVRMQYRGSHTTDSFTIRGHVSMGNDETEQVMHLGSGDFMLDGKRVGECKAG